MAKSNTRTNKFGIPVHVGPVTPALLKKRIALIQKCIDAKKSLDGRKLSKGDVYKASLRLYTYRWQLGKLAPKKSSKRKAS